MKAIMSSILAISLRDYDHFCLGNLIASSRDYDHFVCFCFVFVLPKYLTCKHGPFWKATSGCNPRGVSVHGLFFMHVYLELGQAIC